MPRCLIVSPYFPPSTLAGVHRARHLVKHLPAHGWEPEVICVGPQHHVESLDPALRKLVPPAARIVETGALPLWLTAPLGLKGDIGLRGLAHMRAAIARTLDRRPVDAVLITGSPYYPMLLSGWIGRRWNVPVVLDFQDPWATRSASTAKSLKNRLSLALAGALEPRALRGANWVTSVSERQNDDLAARYPWLNSSRMTAIEIGGDPEDFEALRCNPPARQTVQLGSGTFNFCYVGTFLPRAGVMVRALFRAAAQLRQRQPELGERLRFVFVGTSNQPAGTSIAASQVSPIAAEEGVADLVQEHAARVPYLEALSLLANADAILMLGSDEPHYTASKIYPGLMSGRPWLSVFHEDSSAHTILSRAGGGIALSFCGMPDCDALAVLAAPALERIASSSPRLGSTDPAAYADCTASAVAGRYAAIFDRLVA